MKIKKLWLVTIAALWCSMTVSAEDFSVGGIYYNITSSTDLTVEVTYRGYSYSLYSNEYTGAVTIPATVTYNNKTYRVTSIGSYAFWDCSSLTSITIPAGVTSIGNGAFRDCNNLKFLVCLALTPPTLGESVFASEDLGEIEPMLSVPMESLTDYRDADGWRYLPCTNTMILYISTSRGSWAIEQGGDALKSNSDLGIRTTADDSRQQFAIISHINLDDEVSYYLYHPSEKKFVNKDGGLGYCAAHPVYFKKGAYANTYVVYFDEYHYINIDGSNHNHMVINSYSAADPGNSCTIAVVEDEYDLTEALEKLPVVVDGCSYGRISTDEVKLVSISRTLNELEIPTTVVIKGKNYSVTSIGSWAFSGCSSLTSITIPSSVTSIGNYAFYQCSSLKTVINYSELTIQKGSSRNGYVGYYADKVVNVGEFAGDYAFKTKDGVHYLTGYMGDDTELTLPNDYQGENYQIGSSAFYNCSSLTSITIPEGVTSIGDYTFYGCSNLTSITIPEGVTSIGNATFYGCSNLASITIPENSQLTSIGDYTFSGCSSLTSINIPEGVTSIEGSAFSSCSSLTSITIPEGVTSIGYSAFEDCSSLTSITIPEGVTSIGNYAFYGCSNLTSITILENSQLTSIGAYAFSGCISLQRVLNFSNLIFQKGSSENGYIAYYAKEVINGIRVGDYVFQITDGINYLVGYIGTDTKLYLPENYNGGNYEIAADAFKGKSAITSVSIPEGVTSIGGSAFSDCSSLSSINIPESVTSIGSNAFSGCSGLKSLFVGTNVDTYGENVFEGCTAVEELTVMGSVMPMVPSDKFTTIRMFSPGPLDTEEFDPKVYRTATLYVPEGSLARYQMADVWKKFWYIEEFDPNEEIEVTLDRTTVTMTEGDVITLVATIIPQYIKDKTVTWTTSDAAIATVDNGVVTAVAEGTATITAKAGDKEATCVVTVEKKVIAVSGIALDQTETTLTEGETLTLTATVTPDNATDKTVTWSSSNTSVATVDEHGVVTAVAAGTATITATAGDKTAVCVVTVTKKEDDNENEDKDENEDGDKEDEDAGIDSSTLNPQHSTEVYDLSGRRVLSTENLKGLYIVNGKKVIFK